MFSDTLINLTSQSKKSRRHFGFVLFGTCQSNSVLNKKNNSQKHTEILE